MDEIKELSDIVDSCIIEVEKDNLEQFEKMEMEMEEVDNNQLYELAMSVKKDILDNKRDELKIDNAILRKLELTICTLKKIDSKYNKTMAASMALFFLLGVFIGIQHETWIPYIGQLIDVAKAATNVIR